MKRKHSKIQTFYDPKNVNKYPKITCKILFWYNSDDFYTFGTNIYHQKIKMHVKIQTSYDPKHVNEYPKITCKI